VTAPPLTAPVVPTPEPAGVARLRRAGTRAAVAGALAAAVVGFWWAATGVLLALQRSAGTRVAALAVAVAAGALGLRLTARVRASAARPGAWRDGAAAVLAGALLWTAVSAAFYGGWVVGPAVPPALSAAGAPALLRAVGAITATAYSTALAAALLAAAWRLAGGRGHPAAFAPATFAVLWAAHELAKLNVFAGVANPGAELLPAYLASLRAYFGPARNSALLPISVLALAAATVACAAGAARARANPARRTALALVAGIVALAALEHALLGVRDPVGWWDAFLRWRAGA
jgi:putative photosynthetic complex assembly protein 2